METQANGQFPLPVDDIHGMLHDAAVQNMGEDLTEQMFAKSQKDGIHKEKDCTFHVTKDFVSFESSVRKDGIRQAELRFNYDGYLKEVRWMQCSGSAKIRVVAEVVTPRDLQVAPARRQAGTRDNVDNVRMDSDTEICAVVITNHCVGVLTMTGLLGKGCGWKGGQPLGEECIMALSKLVGVNTGAVSQTDSTVFVFEGRAKDMNDQLKHLVDRANRIGELFNKRPVSSNQKRPRLSAGAKGGEGRYWIHQVTIETGEEILRSLKGQPVQCDRTTIGVFQPPQQQGAPALWRSPHNPPGQLGGYGREAGGPLRRGLCPSSIPVPWTLEQRPYPPLGRQSPSAFSSCGGVSDQLRNAAQQHQDEWNVSRRHRLDALSDSLALPQTGDSTRTVSLQERGVLVTQLDRADQLASHGNCDAAAR